MTDYRKILKFYINHVGACEGATFLDGNDQFDELTAEENEALNLAYHESAEEWIASQKARSA
jgi:hypothetical protein